MLVSLEGSFFFWLIIFFESCFLTKVVFASRKELKDIQITQELSVRANLG